MGFKARFEGRKKAIITDVLWDRVPEVRGYMAESSKAHGNQAGSRREIDGGGGSKGKIR